METIEPYQSLVDDLAVRYGVPTTLTDTHDRMLAFSEHTGALVDDARRDSILARRTHQPTLEFMRSHLRDATGPVRVPRDEQRGMFSRVVLPARWRGVTYGYVFMLDARERLRLDELSPVLDRVADVARYIRLEQVSRQVATRELVALLGSDEQERDVAVEVLRDSGRLAAADPVTVLVASASGASLEPAAGMLWRQANSIEGPWTILGGRLVALLPNTGPEPARRIAVSLREAARDRVGVTVHVGVGEPAPDAWRAHRSYQQALRALRAATALPSLGGVGEWVRLGAWRALLALPESEALDLLDPRVRRLVEDADPDTLQLLRDYLERDGDVRALAGDRHVHRATVYYRIRRVNERYGLQLSQVEDRLATLVGLRLAQLH